VKDFALGAELGRGMMGVVYRARQLSLKREVALKVVSERMLLLHDTEDVLRRFEREVRALIAVSHPNIVRVYDVGREEGVPWVAMELVDGAPLSMLMRESGAMPVDHALHIVRQLADALAACHEKGILHRDVKPGNVLVDEHGSVKLMDFGLAKDSGASFLTHADAFVGTPRYAAPEMFESPAVTVAADVYSLGVILHELLGGQPAYPGLTKENMVFRVLEGPQPLAPLRPELPQKLTAFVDRMLAREADARPGAAELVAAIDSGALGVQYAGKTGRIALLAIEEEAPPPAPRSPPSRPVVNPRSRSSGFVSAPGVIERAAPRGVLFAAVTGAALLALIGGWIATRPEPAPVASARPAAPPSAQESPRAPAARRAPRYPPLFARWREFEGELHALNGADAVAREAIARIRRAVPLELGPGPEPWIHWIELGRWLGGEGPRDRPPRYARAAAGSMDLATFRMLQSDLKNLARCFGPRLVSVALREAGRWPADGRAWVLLGHALAQESAAAEAREAYRWAVSVLPVRSADRPPSGDGVVFEEMATLRNAAYAHWLALAHALLERPEMDLARGWWAHEPGVLPDAWNALAHALRGRPELLDQVLARAPRDETGRQSLELERGRWRALEGDGEAALRIWTASFQADRKRFTTYMTVVEHMLDRGRVAEARAFAGRPASVEAELMLRALEEPDRAPADDTRPFNPRLRFIELGRMISAGRLGEADALMRRHGEGVEGGWHTEAAASFALLGAGAKSALWARTASELLTGAPYDVDGWLEAAGDLATPAGGPHLEIAATATAKAWPASPIPHLARAVWASRQDRHAVALDALAKARAVDRTGLLPAHAVLEVLARPVLMRGIGRQSDEEVVSRALADPGPDDPVAGPIWAALREWRLGDALERARRARELEPHVHAWTLVMLACALIEGPKDRFRKWETEALDSARISAGPVWRMRLVRAIGGRS
jgi:hypothetical protein